MQPADHDQFPAIAMWRINAMRFVFLLIATVMGIAVWARYIVQPMEPLRKAR